MTTISVLDSTGTTQTVAKVANTGSTSDSASLPVAQSTEDKAALAALSAKLPAALGPAAAASSLSVVPASLTTGTDRSSSITTGGTAQVLAASNTSRVALTGQNISSSDLWINEIGGTAAADTAGSYRVPSGTVFKVSTNRAISIIGATTGQKFTATEI